MLAHWVNKQTCTVVQKTETLGTFDHKHQLEQINTHYLSQHYHLAVFSNNGQDCLKVVYFKVSVGHMSMKFSNLKLNDVCCPSFSLERLWKCTLVHYVELGQLHLLKANFLF